jgi:hypothetical protein
MKGYNTETRFMKGYKPVRYFMKGSVMQIMQDTNL